MNRFRTHPQAGFNFDELVVDNFAGGGGASTGIEQAIGRPVDIAINHNPVALAMHETNHPHTKHYCESVWDVDPRKVTQGRPVGLAWFSPDCRHFSKAKGSKPVSPQVRGLAWVVMRWVGTVKPRVIMLENVEEFVTWGPVIKQETPDGITHLPCPKRKGHTFRSFVNALKRHGYQVEWKELRACDYGAPTIRKRLFLVARCDGQPIAWPAATHGPGLKPYRTAADIIDWSLPCPSIFERKKPLADATCRRIAEGIRRFVVESGDPFIVPIANFNGRDTVHDIRDPLRTITAWPKGGHFALVQAFLAKHYTGVIGTDLRKPLGTVTTVDHHSLVTSHMVKLRGTNVGHDAREPLHTISAQGTHHGEVRAFLMKYYSEGGQWQALKEPLHTIPTKDRLGLVMVKGEPYQIVDIGMRMLQPHELFMGQGFPADYIHTHTFDGARLTKADQVKMCGNSVSPYPCKALVEGNMMEPMEAAA
ncbi:DNA cytosine methyltransferase [Alcanivorax sp. S6407]|uniref:DNA cytosine methyltransferase n=1 Tax=Alcanivorax sp. S6407 TaxID=2926424 RepID=UPI001FF6E42A|nr:DNA cytosine methyltransferase [Alcanivorax sp. S6407]MCK0153897.1 DNA cytosine methyltransferase [Alcanivorax sp. S6407]